MKWGVGSDRGCVIGNRPTSDPSVSIRVTYTGGPSNSDSRRCRWWPKDHQCLLWLAHSVTIYTKMMKER